MLGTAPSRPAVTLGRDAERAQLRGLLAGSEARWITLAGPPGVGATHLAAAVFHDLADLRTELRVVDATRGEAPVAHALDEALADRASLRLLVTARGPLGGDAEQVFPVAPLALPDAPDRRDSPSLALFERHARAADLRFTLDDPAHLGAAVDLVRALDGLPGLIVRAAARVHALDVTTLAARVVSDPAVLASARESFDTTVASLSTSAREALGVLSLCPVAFDLALVERLCGAAALDALDALVARALVRTDRGAAGDLRYRTWTPFRAWALALCATKTRRTAERELARYALDGDGLALLPTVVTWGRSPDADTSARTDALHAAVRLARRGSPLDRALRDSLDALLARPDALPADLRAEAHLHLGRDARITARATDAERARDHLAAATRVAREAGSRTIAAHATLEEGLWHHQRRAEAPTRACYERALKMYRALGEAAGEGRALGDLGALDHDMGRYELARERYREALERIRAARDAWLEGAFLGNLGVLEQELGHDIEAERCFRAALGRLEPLGERRLCAITHANLGTLQHARGDARAAAVEHRQAAEALASLGDLRSEGLAWGRLAAALAALGDRAGSRDAAERASRALDATGDPDARAVLSLFVRLAALVTPPHDIEGARLAAYEARHAAGGEAALVERYDDARHAVRLMDAALARLTTTAPGDHTQAELTVEDGARRYRLPNGAWHDLTKHGPMRRILLALAERSAAGDATGLKTDALVAVAWPGERILHDAATNRLYVALSGLRARGLRAWLVRRDDGYLLDPALRVTITKR